METTTILQYRDAGNCKQTVMICKTLKLEFSNNSSGCNLPCFPHCSTTIIFNGCFQLAVDPNKGVSREIVKNQESSKCSYVNIGLSVITDIDIPYVQRHNIGIGRYAHGISVSADKVTFADINGRC